MNFNNYVGLASAYQLLEDYDKAVALFQRGLQGAAQRHMDLSQSGARRWLGAGRIEEAKVAFAEMLRAYPDYTVTKFKQAMVFSPAALERMADTSASSGFRNSRAVFVTFHVSLVAGLAKAHALRVPRQCPE